MSRLSPMPLPVQNVPLKMPAASGSGSGSVSSRPTQSSRSSRRRIGSNGPPVLLGGGAGALGQGQRQGQGPRVASVSPTASTFQKSPLPSPTETVFFTPTLNNPPVSMLNDRRSPSPSPMPPPRPVRRPSPSASSSTSSMPPSSLPAGSNTSLSTASSSSSRTLKTPHSKLDPQYMSPAIASGTGLTPPSQDMLHRPTGNEEERSPTPQARRPSVQIKSAQGQKSPTPSRRMEQDRPKPRERERLPPPAIATGPLPPVPTTHSHPATTRQAPLEPAPRGQEKHVPRLSQDWEHLDMAIEIPQYPVERAKSTSPILPRQTISRLPPAPAASSSATLPSRNRLHDPMMIPLKNQSPSPSRPSFERMHSAPISPTKRDGPSRPEYRSRSSFDQLRSTSPTPPSSRARKTSFSTPPQAIFDTSTSSEKDKSQTGRMNIFRSANSKMSTPSLRARKSDDMLRKSEDGLRKSEDMLQRPSMDLFTKKELKAMQKEAQRNLGVATPPPMADKEKDETRKTSGLSLKKSSGALKALFKSGKGKEKESTPSPPPMPESFRVRSRTTTNESAGSRQVSNEREAVKPRPSLSDDRLRPSFGRSATPGASSPAPSTASAPPSRPVNRDRTPSNPIISNRGTLSAVPFPNGPQGSFPTERSMYPSNPRAATPARLEEPDSERARKPSRDLPPLPMPSSAASQSFDHQINGEKKHSPIGEALPVSSLPYLSTLAGGRAATPVTPDLADPQPVNRATTPTRDPQDQAPQTPSPIKPSRSLHLLSLPDLDLNFDLSFDKLQSPTTPRRASPQKRRAAQAASPTRSVSISSPSKASRPSLVHRTTSERRRSQSFDGPAHDSWYQGGFDFSSRFLATSTSSSAPLLSKPLEPSSSDEGRENPEAATTVATALASPLGDDSMASQHGYSLSYSSQPSAPSSMDHARTDSVATSSPSSPKTPVDEKNSYPFVLGELETTPTKSMVKAKLLGEAISLSRPPSIPLPAVPMPPSSAAPVQVEPPVVVEPIKTEKDKPELKKPRECVKKLYSIGKVINPELPGSNKALARDIERLLLGFRYPSAGATAVDRINTLKSELLPLLFEVEKRPYEWTDEAGNTSLRSVMFEWSDALLFELQIEQTANERGACLEALSAIMESSCLSEKAIAPQRASRDRAKFTKMMIRIVEFVMSKLGAKGVFHNTLLFSGRTLAFAFFRIPHVGEQLVTVLQPPRGALMRFTRSTMMGAQIPSSAQPQYPWHLAPLCFDNARSYNDRLANLSPEFDSEQERDAFLFQPGNWLRRWQSDDSELFPSFYRAYHRQLAQYLAPAIEYYEKLGQPLPAHVLLRAPGYAHLATIFARKCHSYILGSVNAVTTTCTTAQFEATETAGFRASQKPPVLETANRRLVETISTFVQTRIMVPSTQGPVMEYDGSTLWTGIIDLWSKSIIQKTSLYAPKGVFSLFDLLDGIVDPPLDPSTGLVQSPTMDIPYLIYIIRLILTEAEHALTLVKVIAFVFTHWEVLTADPEDRRELCLDILLKKDLFERLLLFWSQSVRSYSLRLVVFRLGHIHTKKDENGHEVEIESVKLLQSRLDSIKRRHDALEPGAGIEEVAESDIKDIRVTTPVPGQSQGGMTRSRSTITMVTDSPAGRTSNKAERLMGLGLGMNEEEKRTGGKATSWFKKLGKNKKRRDGTASPSPNLSVENSPLPESSPSLRSSPLLPELALSSPVMSSPTASSESSEGDSVDSTPAPPSAGGKRARPPMILTHSPEQPQITEGNAFSFEFELPTSSPRSDAFDPVPSLPPASPQRRSQPPSPSQTQPSSPHMSRSFSKRSSLLPPQTARELEMMMSSEANLTPKKSNGDDERGQGEKKEVELGYDQKSHAYAIRMLAELEDAQKEYDEWWSEGGVGKVDGAPPRLTVAWPFHENEE